ncbi:MAG: HAD family phosphatase [Negativicutes bacterium]|nr:HAD family phosphatase [Negativicutes bacterium]
MGGRKGDNELIDLELIIFDMDGLMFDTERMAFTCWRQAAFRYGYEVDENVYIKVIGANAVREKEIYLNLFGEQFPFEKIRNDGSKISETILHSSGVPIKNGLHELLAYIEKINLKKAVATSTSRDKALRLLRMAGLLPCFDYVLCGDDIAESKPHPEIFLNVAAKLGCSPDQCLVLEDSEAGILAAHRAGMRSIMIPDMKKPEEEVKALLLQQMNSLDEVKTFLEEIYGQGRHFGGH